MLQVENPYFDASQQQPRNTVQLRPQKLQNLRARPQSAQMPLKMPKHTGGSSLEHLLRPSGLQNMNAQQQYNKLVQMRAEIAQRSREDNAMREFQRMAAAGQVDQAFNMRQARDLEMSDAMLQNRPFTPDPQGGFITSGAERAGAMTQARRGLRQPPAPPAAPEAVPPPGGAAPRRRGGGLMGFTLGATR